MDNILKEVIECQRCNDLQPWIKFKSNTHGNINSKYMLISEAPGKQSIKNNQYWTGSSGSRIRNISRNN